MQGMGPKSTWMYMEERQKGLEINQRIYKAVAQYGPPLISRLSVLLSRKKVEL